MGSQNTAPLNVAKPSSAFSSMTSKPSGGAAAGSATGGVFGSIALTSSKTAAPVPPKSTNVFGSIALSTPSNNGVPIGIKKTPAAPSAAATSMSTATTPSGSGEPKSKMHKLNKSFISWLDKQMVNHSVSNWTAGLQDYIKHADKIAATLPVENGDVSNDVAAVSNKTEAAASTAPKFGGFSAAPTNPKPDSAPKFGGFSAATSQKNDSNATSSAPKFGGFGQTTASAPTKPAATFTGFSAPSTSGEKKPDFGGFGSTSAPSKPAATFGGFGSTATTASSNPPAFSGFGGAATTAKPTAPVASFGAGATSSTNAGAGGETEEYEGEPILEPEKIYKNENDTDEILYETNCKAFRFDTKEKEWKESGKGTLRITQEPGVDKKKVLVRNAIGKITINSYIFKGMNFKQAGKAGLQFMAVTDASGVPQSYLVKVKPSEIQTTVEKFKEAEEQAKK